MGWRVWGSKDRNPVEVRFSAPVQIGPGAHSASYTMGTGSLFRGVKQPGRGVDHPPPTSVRVKERVELYIYSVCKPYFTVFDLFPVMFLAWPLSQIFTGDMQLILSPAFQLA
jgi:hypothetical protein